MRMRSFLLAAALLTVPAPMLAQALVTIPVDAPAEVGPAPARVVMARKLMDRLLPPGAMQRLMQTTIGSMSESMIGAILPTAQRDTLRAKDPAFDERFRRTMAVMSAEMGRIMTAMEPQMKDAMAVAYARRFDERQLTDIGAFFATPSGAAYAREALSISADPALVQLNMSMLPKLIGAMPEIKKKIDAATADLPPPPRPDNK